MHIRLAITADADAIQPLMAQLGYDLTAAAIAPHIETPPHDYCFYVAVIADEVVGFLAIAHHFYFADMSSILRVMALCVASSHRSQGIGGALLAHGIAQSYQQDPSLRHIEVTCACHRDQAHRFYERQGFHRQGIRLVRAL